MNTNQLKNKYEENGPMGLSYSEMNSLFDKTETLEIENELLKKKIIRLENEMKKIVESETIDVAKRTARIALS